MSVDGFVAAYPNSLDCSIPLSRCVLEVINVGGKDRPGGWKQQRWVINLKTRIKEGKEYCRHCGVFDEELTLDHIIPYCEGGPNRLDNLTILCKDCQQLKGNKRWDYQYSLEQEGYWEILSPLTGKPLPTLPKRKRGLHRPKIQDFTILCTPKCSIAHDHIT